MESASIWYCNGIPISTNIKSTCKRIYKRWMEYKHFCYDDDNDRNEYDKKKMKIVLGVKSFYEYVLSTIQQFA